MNTISLRISDFLKNYPPFDSLEKDVLLKVATTVEIIHLDINKPLFEIGNPISNHFYVVKNGAVGLYRDTSELVDKCDDGDLFGLRALLRKGDYILNAIALEESLIYAIPFETWESQIATNPGAVTFVMASLASNTKGIQEDLSTGNTTLNNNLEQLQTAEYSKNPVTCPLDTSIQEAASVMSKKKVGSIIIVNDNKPLGIITDKDLRTKVATGKFAISDGVEQIMSSPVLTFPERISVAEAQLAMLRHRITHLCITEDGSTNSVLTGVLSEHDIIVLRELTAASLIKEIKRSHSVNELRLIRQKAETLLKKYLEQGAPIAFIGKLLSAINDAITTNIISKAIEHLGNPPCKYAWIAIGSQGRQEQLLMTDQDNALVFEDVDKRDLENVKAYFINLSEKVNKQLALVGFELCPANMMASNPQWCQSLSEWKQTFSDWIKRPDQDKLMLCTIFFDFELIYGDKNLINQLSTSIFKTIEQHDIFLNYLGRNALQNPPPLSFFRQFLVEESGKHKDQFDIKARAIMPLVDGARLLILSHNIKSVNNTLERYLKLAELEPQNEDVYLFCAESFKDLLRFRTVQGLAQKDSGRFILLDTLNKGDRLKLKRSFKAIKQIQDLIRTRYKLSQLM